MLENDNLKIDLNANIFVQNIAYFHSFLKKYFKLHFIVERMHLFIYLSNHQTLKMGHAQLFQVTIDLIHNVITYKPKFFLSHKMLTEKHFFIMNILC